jgi:hypothetical protein
MTVHDCTVQKSQKGQKWYFDPRMAILALFSSFLNVACVLLVQKTISIIMNGEGKEKR